MSSGNKCYLYLCASHPPGSRNSAANERNSTMDSEKANNPPPLVNIDIPFDDNVRFTIGRSINQNLQLSRCKDGKEVISRRHAEVYKPYCVLLYSFQRLTLLHYPILYLYRFIDDMMVHFTSKI